MNKQLSRVNQHKKSKGQGLVEFALVLPLLVLVAVGVLDLGRVFFELIVITNASRDGVRYLVLHPSDRGLGYVGTIATAENEVADSFSGLVTVTAECPDDPDNSGYCRRSEIAGGALLYPARVTVSHDFYLITGFLFPGPLTLERSTEMWVP